MAGARSFGILATSPTMAAWREDGPSLPFEFVRRSPWRTIPGSNGRLSARSTIRNENLISFLAGFDNPAFATGLDSRSPSAGRKWTTNGSATLRGSRRIFLDMGMAPQQLSPRQERTDHLLCKLCKSAFKAISWSHLWFVHCFRGEHPIQDYKSRFRLKTARSLATRKLLRRLHRQWHERNRVVAAAAILTEIRERNRKGLPVNGAAFPRSVYLNARAWFGSWGAALARCGIRHGDVRRNNFWTKERVKKAIVDRYRNGERLDGFAVVREFPSLINAAMRFAGSWERAIRSCGLDYDKIRRYRKWSRKAIIRYLRERHSRGLPLNRSAVARDLDVTEAAIRNFGTWEAALEASGFHAQQVRLRRPNWTRDQFLMKIRQLKSEGFRLTSAAIKRTPRGSGLLKSARRLFGGWKEAVEASGIEYPDWRD